MNILVANDDGIQAEGISRLVEALSEVADVYVCAPDGNRSCASHSICMRQDIHIRKSSLGSAKFALACSGSPVDCVKLGLKVYRDLGIEIDMVFAGINHGSNVGIDTMYSGTVGAAVEGSICGKPSVAVSVTSHDATNFDYACRLAVSCIKHAADRIRPEIPLNINVPDIPDDEIKGVKYVRMGWIDYRPWFILQDGTEGIEEVDLVYRYGGEPVFDENQGMDTDVIATRNGYATIAAVHYDMTSFEGLEEIKKWRIEEC